MCRARRACGGLVGGIKPGFARSAPPGALFRRVGGLPWICTRGTQTADSLPRRRGLQRGSAWISVHAAITLNSRRHCILPSIMVTRRFLAALALATASAKVFFEGEFSFGPRARARRRRQAAALVHTSAPSTRAKCCNAKPSHCHLRATTPVTRPSHCTHHPRTTPRDAAAAPTPKHTTKPNAPRPRDRRDLRQGHRQALDRLRVEGRRQHRQVGPHARRVVRRVGEEGGPRHAGVGGHEVPLH